MIKTDDTFRRLKYHEVKAIAGTQGRHGGGAKALWYCFHYDIPVAKIDDCKCLPMYAFADPSKAQTAGALKYCRSQDIQVVWISSRKYGDVCGFVIPCNKLQGCKRREAEEVRLTADYRLGVESAGVVARVSGTGA